MIKNDLRVTASLGDIYSEIVSLSASIGECKSAIEHVDSCVYRMHMDIKDQLTSLGSRVTSLEMQEKIRSSRSEFFWKLLHISPVNIVKWSAIVTLIVSLVGFSVRQDMSQRLWKVYNFVFS